VLEPGAILAEKFRIERILGSGGMGVVAVATNVQLEQQVALKLLHERLAGDGQLVERFLREARAAAKLRSEHVCRVFDVARLPSGAPYMVMELLDGQDLAGEFAKGPLAVGAAIDLVLQACVGIGEAHARGIVHRDLKPANLFVTKRLDGTPLVKVLDFGIAKALEGSEDTALTRTDSVMGTPSYMSPEQLRNSRDVDIRTDIWALGVILYEALTQRLPFPGTSLTELAVKISIDPPQPLDVEPALRDIVFRCLDKDPAARYPDVAALARALAPFGGATAAALAGFATRLVAEGLAQTAPPTPAPASAASREATAPTVAVGAAPSATSAVPRARSRRRLVVTVAAVIACGVLTVAGSHVFSGRGATESPTASTEQASAPGGSQVRHGPITILIADLANRTSDPMLDGTLEPALAVSLGVSPLVTVYPRNAALSGVARANPSGSRLDPETARTVATQDSVGAVLTGSIENAGTGYALELQLVDGKTGTVIATATGRAPAADRLWATISELAGQITRQLGDTADRSAELVRVEAFTASSLAAAHAYGRARAAQDRGDDPEAIAEYQQAIALDPDMTRAYANLAITLVNQGRGQEADKNFQMWLARFERVTERERLQVRGVYFLASGDLEHGIEELDQLTKKYPTDLSGAIMLCVGYALRRDFRRAVESARRGLALVPKYVVLRSNLARTLFYLGDSDHAAPVLVAILAENPRYARARRVLALLTLLRGDVARAEAIWNELAATGDDGASEAALGQADLALYEGRIEDGIAKLEAGIATDVSHAARDAMALKLVMLAHAQATAGKLTPARQTLDRALHASSTAEIVFWAARTYAQMRDDAAVSRLSEQLGAHVGELPRVEVLLVEGERQLEHGHPREAIASFNAAQQQVDTWLGRFDLARAYVAAAAFPQALAEAETALKRLPEGAAALIDEQPTAYLLPEAYYTKARALEGLGSSQASDAYRRMLALAHGQPSPDPLFQDAARRLDRLTKAAGARP
jgi:serine/threonine-protein kinase